LPARLRHRPTPGTGQRPSVDPQSRHRLSGAAPTRTGRLDRIVVEHVGEQPPRALLRHHRRRTTTARRRNGAVDAHVRHRRAGAEPFERTRMTRLRLLAARLRALVVRTRMDRDFDDEIRDHLARAAEDHLARGLTPDRARAAALAEFGSPLAVREAHAELRT